MEIDEALAKAPLVTISNLELFEICWLLDLNLSKPNDSKEKKDGLEMVRTILIEKGAVVINCIPENDVQSAGAYKILSASHGFFKQTAYESQAFIQICLDAIDENNTKYAILAIVHYDSSELNKLWLNRFHSLKTT